MAIHHYKYKKATIEDINELVRTRIIVLRAANKLIDDTDMTKVEQESYTYYKSALYEKYGFVKMKDKMELMKWQEYILCVMRSLIMTGKKTEPDL